MTLFGLPQFLYFHIIFTPSRYLVNKKGRPRLEPNPYTWSDRTSGTCDHVGSTLEQDSN